MSARFEIDELEERIAPSAAAFGLAVAAAASANSGAVLPPDSSGTPASVEPPVGHNGNPNPRV
jgi:hypothetical protein